MPQAIQVHETGGPEVMRLEEVAVGEPGPGEARIRHAAVGLNYIDVYFRMGLYPSPSLPFSPGMEGAGEVLAVGEGVTDLAVGDRVAYAGALGAYAEERGHRGGPAGADPRFGERRDGRVHDAPGHDRPVPPQGQLSGQGR